MDDDKGKQLHVLFLPYFATGHIIPLVNAARLFAYRGVNVTILTTHHNASLFRSSIDNNDVDSHSVISIHTLTFPSFEVGLPEGFENFSFASSTEILTKIFYAIYLLQKPMEDKIREIHPDCIFSDMFFPWTVDIARELNIPRLLFNQSSYMYNSILQNLKLYEHLIKDLESQSSSDFFVPGLPDKIEFKLSQLTEDLKKPDDEKNAFDELLDQVRDSEDRSYGIVHDTFYELEPAYADYYQKMKKTKCWHIGPISHFSSKLIRRKELIIDAADESNSCALIEWLNEQKHRSVLYVSFGSSVRFPENQLTEIAKALQASTVPFVWIVKKDQSSQTTWLPDGFEEKLKKKGLIIRGWAPQLTILDHPAIGGFMTHCGWNSVLEAIVAGIPLLTWPVFAEQFYNEKFVEVMGLGVKLGAEVWNSGGGVEILSPLLGSEKIKEAIKRLMSDSRESQNIREKVMSISKMAKDALEEGGSSWNSLRELIDDINNCTSSSLRTTMG